MRWPGYKKTGAPVTPEDLGFTLLFNYQRSIYYLQALRPDEYIKNNSVMYSSIHKLTVAQRHIIAVFCALSSVV
jgi:hypothetical protein